MKTERTWYKLDDKFTFGKFKGKTLLEVYNISPNYIEWCLAKIPTFFMLGETYNKLVEHSPKFKFSDDALLSVKYNIEYSEFDYDIDKYEEEQMNKADTREFFGYYGPEDGFGSFLESNGLD